VAQSKLTRDERQDLLQEKLIKQPYLTDGELAELFGVSVPTIRLDRMTLGIPELRERLKSLAESEQVDSAKDDGQITLVDIEKGVRGISIMDTTSQMCFDDTDIVKGSCIYSMAESLALDVLGKKVAIAQVGNIKYKMPVVKNTRLVARGEVREQRRDSCILWVKIYNKESEVYRGKFIFHVVE